MSEEEECEEKKSAQQCLQEFFSKRVGSKNKIREALVKRTQKGGITLVVGAGVSIPRGVPSWDALARAMWETTFPDTQSPWEGGDTSPQRLPQFLPIVFELVYRELGDRDKFAKVLREHLYTTKVKYPRKDEKFDSSSESLAVLGRLLLQEFERGQGRRIDAVITLNADELLEQAAMTLVNRKQKKGTPVYPFTLVRMSTHTDLGQERLRRIPIYHIHGFLSQTPKFFDAEYMLVFSDLQYWSTSASALTFANRVVSWALNESCCIFVGLSMTDINLLRWLALRALELERDVSEAVDAERQTDGILRSFIRHYWIRPSSSDPSGFLTRFMRLRGIESVKIGEWKGKSFQNLIEKCFPKDDPESEKKKMPPRLKTKG
ncbi:MAG TPA: SIR2 family protein [Pyrinomonadaceae bacterium]|nr:SIR2 family protein [Pyrinomonadaceae bacterium]